MASNNTNIIKPIDSLIEYIKEVKPYHTKFLEVIEKYNFFESMNITFTETIFTGIGIENKPLCSPVGFGLEWDEPCGFDPLSCCDLFECVGGYGLIYDNSDILVTENIQAIDSTLGTVTISGDHRYDTKLQIKSIPTAVKPKSVTVEGDYTTEFGVHSLFIIEPIKIYEILNTTTDSVTIEGAHTNQFINNSEFKIISDALNSGTYTVIDVNEVSGNTVIDVTPNTFTASVSNLGSVESKFICKNQGVFQVDSSSFDGTYTTVIVTNDRIFDFTDATDLGRHGSIVLRTGLMAPRRITLIGNDVANDRDYKVLQTTYNSIGDTTTLLLNANLVGSSTTGTVNLIGYTFGQGFDGLEECSVPKPANIHNNFAEFLSIEVIDIVAPTPTPTITPTITPTPSLAPPSGLTVVITGTTSDFCENLIEFIITFSAPVTIQGSGNIENEITFLDSQSVAFPVSIFEDSPGVYIGEFSTSDFTEITIIVPAGTGIDGSLNSNTVSNTHVIDVAC